MKMKIKEQLLTISELKLADRIEQMNDEQLSEYIQILNSFIENFPEKERELKSILEAKDYDIFAKYLAGIGDMLFKIHADDMVLECKNRIKELKNAKYEKIEAFATYFLKSASMLFDDMQKILKIMSKEQLLLISDLNAEKIRQMNDEQLDKYVQALDFFIENFPEKEKELKNILEARDYDVFAKYLASIGDMLSKIHADDMALECKNRIKELKNAKYEKIEAFATYFLKSASILSIDRKSVV